MSNTPLLAASDLRVDIDGVAVLDRVSFRSRGRSLAIAGDAQGVFGALFGEAQVRAGTMYLRGHDVFRREHIGEAIAGFAPLDPPLPDHFSARDYLSWGARLAGIETARAKKLAHAALAELDLERIGGTRLDRLALHERRALVIAQAIVTHPAVLVAAAPLSGLAGEPAAYVERVLATATQGRSWIVSLSSLHPASREHTLASGADEVFIFASGALARSGKLSHLLDQSGAYSLVLRGHTAEFRTALEARGVTLSGGPRRFFVELPAGMKTDDLLLLSTEVGAPIVELLPELPFTEPSLETASGARSRA